MAAIFIVGYFVVAWVLPLIVGMLFRDLPYLQERGFLERFGLSAIGTGVLLATMAIAFPERFRVYQGKTPWETTKTGVFVTFAFAAATAVAAFWSGNIFGTLTKLTPGTEYSARFNVFDVDTRISRKGMWLAMTPKGEKRDVELTLTRRLFDSPQIKVGDELILKGKQNVFGIYVDDFEVTR